MFTFNSFGGGIGSGSGSGSVYTYNDICDLLLHDDTTTVLNEIEKKNLNINQQDTRTKNTLLHIAIKEKNIKVIDLLLSKGADINIKNRKGETCCDLLASSGLGSTIHKIVDKYKSMYSHNDKELIDSKNKIKILEQDVKGYIDANKRIAQLKQEVECKYGNLELVVITLRKRKIDLENKCDTLEKELNEVKSSRDNLIKASKKQRV
jgi:ankyrin repeat protein